MSDYTPTTEELRAAWLANQSTERTVRVGPVLDGFDRWLAEVERSAAEKALTDAAESYEGHLTEPELPMEDQPSPMARHYKSTAVRLRARAEAYRQERKDDGSRA